MAQVSPERTCIGCRHKATKAELVRLVWSEDAQAVVIDWNFRLPGRGGYLHCGCVGAVVARKAVGRALRRGVDLGQVAALLSACGDPGSLGDTD